MPAPSSASGDDVARDLATRDLPTRDLATRDLRVDALKELLLTTIALNDRRYDERFRESERAFQAALESAKEAVLKAEAASEKRFAGLNELRGAMEDQQRLYMPRSEAEIRMRAIEEQGAIAAKQLSGLMGQKTGGRETWGWVFGAAALALTVVGAIIVFATTIMVKK
jgi:hypothetical protein